MASASKPSARAVVPAPERALTVAIVGRPNVGKSTLFNRLVGRRIALVDDTPGVTRDRRVADGAAGGLVLRVIDTAGLEEAFDDSLEARMRRQTERALADADVALLMVDARAGVLPLDAHFARWLRRGTTPVVLLANKCEGRAGQDGLAECHGLGLGDPVPLSAEHGEGLADLVGALLPHYQAIQPPADDPAGDGPAGAGPGTGPGTEADTGPDDARDTDPDADSAIAEDDPAPRVLQLAIVGKPNVGKSTLINRLIGEDRLLTGPEAGITRDSIAVDWHWKEQPLRLVDTAGLRRKARVVEKLERLSVQDTERSVQFAQVVALLLDATEGPAKQDLTIARHVIDEGRALIMVLNKWDAVADKTDAVQALKDRLETSLPQAKGVPWVTVSGLTGQGMARLLDTVVQTYDLWTRRIATPVLNRWLQAVVEAHPPPAVAGRRLRLRYMTQPKTRPPTFALFVSRPDQLPDSYQRYLVNQLRLDFDLPGVPVRLLLRKGRNPYAKS